MSGTNAVVLWVLGGAGTLLLYSAVKNQSPTKTLLTGLNVNTNSAAASPVSNYQAPGTVKPVANIPGDGSAQVNGYWQGADKWGSQNLYSSDGRIVGVVDASYSKSPGTYIMPQDA